jgi:hypothetical protein
MINPFKWSRLMGDVRGIGGVPQDVLPTLDFSLLKRLPPESIVPGGSTMQVGGCFYSVYVQAAAGGIAAGTSLFVIPNNISGLITTQTNPSAADNSFHPGLYRINHNYIVGTGMGLLANRQLGLTVIPAAATTSSGRIRATQSPGGILYSAGQGTTVALTGMSTTWFIPEPWKLHVGVPPGSTAWLVGETIHIFGDVSCLHLMDNLDA